jgi:hypothetical protein
VFYDCVIACKRDLAVLLVDHNGIWFYLLHVIRPRVSWCLDGYDALILVDYSRKQLRGPSLDVPRKNVIDGLREFVVLACTRFG